MSYTLQYYDLVLLGVIVPTVTGLAIGAYTAVQMVVAVLALGGVSIAVIVYALFVNGPVDRVRDLSKEVEQVPGPADDLLD